MQGQREEPAGSRSRDRVRGQGTAPVQGQLAIQDVSHEVLSYALLSAAWMLIEFDRRLAGRKPKNPYRDPFSLTPLLPQRKTLGHLFVPAPLLSAISGIHVRCYEMLFG